MYIYLDLTDVPTSIPLEGLDPQASPAVHLSRAAAMFACPAAEQESDAMPSRAQGFDTETPKLLLPDGRELEGTYADALGSQLFFESEQAGEERKLKLVGLSEKVVRFRAPPEAAATTKES